MFDKERESGPFKVLPSPAQRNASKSALKAHSLPIINKSESCNCNVKRQEVRGYGEKKSTRANASRACENFFMQIGRRGAVQLQFPDGFVLVLILLHERVRVRE